jgi:hypothetical protein
MWGALSDKRTGLSVTIAAGPRQRSHSRVRVPWDSRPYFTVSDSRLPFSSPPTTRRATVEVFGPASTRDISEEHIASIFSQLSTDRVENIFPKNSSIVAALPRKLLFLLACSFRAENCLRSRYLAINYANFQVPCHC